jgi:hypothetical protein
MMDYPGETPGVLNQTELQEHVGVQEPVGVHTPTPENEKESAGVAEGDMEVASAGVTEGDMEVTTPGDTPTSIPANAPINNNGDSDDDSEGRIKAKDT